MSLLRSSVVREQMTLSYSRKILSLDCAVATVRFVYIQADAGYRVNSSLNSLDSEALEFMLDSDLRSLASQQFTLLTPSA